VDKEINTSCYLITYKNILIIFVWDKRGHQKEKETPLPPLLVIIN
jgi:hypothetical protein